MEPKELIREKIDVVDLVGESLVLKGAGQGSFKALCPFHGEKTPSFYVHRAKQIWHCFGCDKGGDIFAWTMAMEGVEFSEALEILAKKAGVEIPKYERKGDDGRERLRAINAFARAVYRKYLASPLGAVARAYLDKRGIDDVLAERFGIGYAPEGWTALCEAAAKKKIGSKELMDAGLALPSKGRSGTVDRFRNRLMIPLCDHHGNTVGFTGRVLDPKDSPKYMNSPQTPIYDKSALLFGLHLAKAAIKREGCVVVVEGNLDVVASHKAGVEHVVASSGTALTERHIQLLKRYTTTLVFSFDADAAGFAAARRGMQLASQLGCTVRVACVPATLGKDPDEVVQKDPEAWRKIVANPTDKMTFLFERLMAPVRHADVESKKKAGAEFLPEIAALADAIEREHWLKRFAEAVDVPVEVVRREVGDIGSHGTDRTHRTDTHERATSEKPRSDSLLDLVFSCALGDRANAGALADRFVEANLPPAHRALYAALTAVYHAPHTSQHPSWFDAVRSHMHTSNPTLVPELDRLALVRDRYVDTDAPNGDDIVFSALLDRLADRLRLQQRATLSRALKEAEQSGDRAKVEELSRALQSLL